MRKISQETIDQMVSFYKNDKLSIPEISKIVKLPKSTVRNRLLMSGVALRSKKESKQIFYSRNESKNRGIKRKPFSNETRQKMSEAKQKWASENARGISVKPNGYKEITRGPNKGRCEHVVVMEEKIGRSLFPNEVVHHIDGVRSNNTLDNLELMTRSEHTRFHALERSDNNGLVEYEGRWRTVSQWAKELEIEPDFFKSRFYSGWTIEEIIFTPKYHTRRGKENG